MSAPNFAEIYERTLVPAIFKPWALDLLDRTRPSPSDRVLDLACGTGIVARLARERLGAGARIAGVDVNPQMIAVARCVAPDISWHEASAGELPFQAQTFDIVFCQEALQFFPDRAAAVGEIHRVLVENGRVAISTWRPLDENPLFAGLHAAATRHFGPHPDRRFGFGDADAICALLLDAGFREVRADVVTREETVPDTGVFVALNLSATMPALAQMNDEQRGEAVARLRSDAAETLARFAAGPGLVHPVRANVVRAVA